MSYNQLLQISALFYLASKFIKKQTNYLIYVLTIYISVLGLGCVLAK